MPGDKKEPPSSLTPAPGFVQKARPRATCHGIDPRAMIMSRRPFLSCKHLLCFRLKEARVLLSQVTQHVQTMKVTWIECTDTGVSSFTQGESEPESLAATFKYSDLHFASTVPGPGVTRGRAVTSEQSLCQQCPSLCVIVILVSRSLIDPGHVVTSWPMIHRQGQRGE